jgi:transcriptional regulator with XRE-family HTH domain
MPDKKLTLSDQVALLFEHGKASGLPTTYRAIAEATGESPNNLQQIHRGENTNPGLRTLSAIAVYFGVSLAYFDCKTEEECRQFLAGVTQSEKSLDGLALRAEALSPEGLKALEQMIEYVRSVEVKGKSQPKE